MKSIFLKFYLIPWWTGDVSFPWQHLSLGFADMKWLNWLWSDLVNNWAYQSNCKLTETAIKIWTNSRFFGAMPSTDRVVWALKIGRWELSSGRNINKSVVMPDNFSNLDSISSVMLVNRVSVKSSKSSQKIWVSLLHSAVSFLQIPFLDNVGPQHQQLQY